MSPPEAIPRSPANGLEETPLSAQGEANSEVLLGGKAFHVLVIVVDQLSSDAILWTLVHYEHCVPWALCQHWRTQTTPSIRHSAVFPGIPFGARASIMCGNGTRPPHFRDGAWCQDTNVGWENMDVGAHSYQAQCCGGPCSGDLSGVSGCCTGATVITSLIGSSTAILVPL